MPYLSYEQYPIVPTDQNLLVEEIGIDRRIHTPIIRTIAYYANFSGPVGPGNRYVSIDKFAYLSKVSIGIDEQYPNLLTYQ